MLLKNVWNTEYETRKVKVGKNEDGTPKMRNRTFLHKRGLKNPKLINNWDRLINRTTKYNPTVDQTTGRVLWGTIKE